MISARKTGERVFMTVHHWSNRLRYWGAPLVELGLEADKPVAMIAVRLSDIAPDNKATRISYGLLNLTHRNCSEFPEILEPGKRYRVKVDLNYIGQVIAAGHRIRVAVSTSYWPMAWPAPELTGVKLYTSNSRLLPTRKPQSEDAQLRPFEPPEAAPPERMEVIRPEYHNWTVVRDLATDVSQLKVVDDSRSQYIQSIDQAISRIVLSSLPENFYLRAELDAYEGDKRVYSQNWDYVIPWDLV